MNASTRANLCTLTITNALTAVGQVPVTVGAGCKYLVAQCKFTYGSGGTTAKVWLQTSIDGGTTWIDIANFAFALATASKLHSVVLDQSTAFTAGTAPASGVLADNTVLNGVIGDKVRALVTTTGTYAGGTTLIVDVVAKE